MTDLVKESQSVKPEIEDMSALIRNLRLDKGMIDMCNSISGRLKNDWDCCICVSGEERVGKSSLACILGFIMDNRFHLNKNVAYLPNHQEIEEKFWELKAKQIFVIDEAIKALYKLRFMDRFQTRINEMYATEGWQNKVTILCIPRFTDLNEFFRNDRVKFWIHVPDRGHAVIFAKDEVNIWGTDRWHIKEEYSKINSMIRKNYANYTASEKLNIYRKSKHYMGEFMFPQLPPEVEKKYRELKVFYRKIPDEKEKAFKTQTIINLLKHGKLTESEIAEAVGKGCSVSWVSQVKKRYITKK